MRDRPMTRYTTKGSVRGQCGHMHRTIDSADRCAAKDRRDCAGLGGGAYSDREVYVVTDGRIGSAVDTSAVVTI